ncbi:MAG: 4-hydroxythreonine-4-phosphate dehydrogenase PdxA [Candidatus Aminicenantes bacterium]|nr:4-hydroxythreonine-4-phosphate dehydrogenase PdxA [Candidatus Aminicenantes bacterium]
MNLPKVGITIGDPGGIGPEITLKALFFSSKTPDAQFVIFGSNLILQKEIQKLGIKQSFPSDRIQLHEIPYPGKTVSQGIPHRNNGKASFAYFEEAVNQARKGTIHALVTAPISKYSWQLAGITNLPGHTEYLSRFYPQSIMFFWSDKLKVALFTHHLSLRQAIDRIKKESLENFFHQLYENIERLCPGSYSYVAAGLNPHAGEDGLMGKEEIATITPAIKSMQKAGIPITGPYPPDVVFRQFLGDKNKIIIAFYHDQGLIPFKLLAFETGVNMTLGLPFIRTSPDHGTAFDIAGTGTANPKSMKEAIKLAIKFTPRKNS